MNALLVLPQPFECGEAAIELDGIHHNERCLAIFVG